MVTNKPKVVLAHGTFDLLHPGHLAYLEFAKRQGDKLVVSVTSDEMVRAKKGSGRPILPFTARKRMVEALRCVDQCVETLDWSEQGAYNIMQIVKEVRPDVLVSSYGNYAEDFSDELARLQVQLVVVPYFGGVSTTGLINNIVDKYSKTTA